MSSVPLAPPVIVAAGSGPPPVPTGGPIVEGAYQLVSETVYGSSEPDVLIGRAGNQAQGVLVVQCDLFNELFAESEPMGGFGGNLCGRLSLQPDAASGEERPFTAAGDMLYLISVDTYRDSSRGIVLGTYEVVDAFARVGATPSNTLALCVASGSEMSRPIASGKRDPGCPPSPPSPGEPCNPQPPPLECEYGGDLWNQCTIFAACAKQSDGRFQFQLDPPSLCPPPNPPECPSAFADGLAIAGTVMGAGPDAGCPGPSISCNYAEGGCVCEPRSVGCQWSCRARTDVQWQVDSGDPCPVRRPLSGDPCADEGQQCEYGALCDGVLFGPSMVCQHGNWAQAGEIASCPLEWACSAPHLQLGDGGSAD